MKLHIFGASGPGTTTLGKKLAQLLNCKHLDADDYYWEPTDPAYQHKVPPALRNEHITQDFERHETVIISGSLVSWGKRWESAFNLAVFLYLPIHFVWNALKNERYGDMVIFYARTKRQSRTTKFFSSGPHNMMMKHLTGGA
ncbi:MAG: hypothetical protein MJA30_35835 [Cytophagales bacterium]|nr:hypothetical protein [Cytophagales bacterium]